MDPSKKDDRRKHSRVGFTTRIDIWLDGGRGNEISLEGSSKDLSLKGIFVKTQTQFPMETPCRIDIFLTGGIDEIKLDIIGKIVRQTEDGIGIVFESMDVDTYTHLKNIVYYNSGDDSI